ncbi:MAG: hypothetical protein LBG04_02435 [Holosporaceae bacterium]|jgi:hypothetical protein|nr:hypothetical protein [Holosporaceae bacterium]
MLWRWIKAVIALPFNVLVMAPAVILSTTAPWNHSQKLVIADSHCRVGNLIITSVLIMMVAESLLLLNSWHIFVLFLVLLTGNFIYFLLVEEKDLKKDSAKITCNINAMCHA